MTRRAEQGTLGLLLILLACAAGGVGPPAVSPVAAQACSPSAEETAQVRAVAEGIIEADNHRDIDAVMALYAPAATLYPPGEGPVVGHAAIRPRYEGLFADFDPAIEAEIGSVTVCGGLGVVTGRNGGVFRSRTGPDERALSDVYVMVVERVEGRWLITRLMWHPDGPAG